MTQRRLSHIKEATGMYASIRDDLDDDARHLLELLEELIESG